MKTRRKTNKKHFSRLVETRITQEKYEELEEVLKQSIGIRSLSELLRTILDNKPIAVRSYDISTDHLLGELTAVRKELHAIGNNINQVTHRLHIEDTAEGKVSKALQIADLYQQTGEKVTELFTLISKLSEQWWPK